MNVNKIKLATGSLLTGLTVWTYCAEHTGWFTLLFIVTFSFLLDELTKGTKLEAAIIDTQKAPTSKKTSRRHEQQM